MNPESVNPYQTYLTWDDINLDQEIAKQEEKHETGKSTAPTAPELSDGEENNWGNEWPDRTGWLDDRSEEDQSYWEQVVPPSYTSYPSYPVHPDYQSRVILEDDPYYQFPKLGWWEEKIDAGINKMRKGWRFFWSTITCGRVYSGHQWHRRNVNYL